MNNLAKETSPYLLQHKANPVSWFAWGEEAFTKSRNEKKPIFLSIGYSTCYWCHVMEKDSFERNEVAAILNEHFVSIKVDREERPDVDAIYMDAVVQLTGHGGWPMSVFLTPELKPFFGGTYFPRERFISLLHQIAGLWNDSHDKVLTTAEEFVAFLKSNAAVVRGNFADNAAQALSERQIVDSFTTRFDPHNGGFGGAPKFPPTGPLRLLTSFARESDNVADPVAANAAKHIVQQTLDSMAAGGIYDQLGGGFHRYSVDAAWLVPHFEKMLYDNALLSRTYLDAYAAFGQQRYREVAEHCLNYVLQVMTAPSGGFYSAEDAGEVGKEGEFYVWTEQELRHSLNASEFERISSIFDISAGGNFEHGTNVLSLRRDRDWSVRFEPDLKLIIDKLIQIRAKRIPPFKDDKIITAWNGLMIGAMAVASRLTARSEYSLAAVKAAETLNANVWLNGKLYRTFRSGEARHNAVLEDYVFLIDGLIELYQSTLDEKWLLWAKELQDAQDSLFWDEVDGGYYSSDINDRSLVVRKKELMDNAEPAANALAVGNLSRLSVYFLKPEWRERAEQLIALFRPITGRYPHGFSYSLLMEKLFFSGMEEIVISGAEAAVKIALREIDIKYDPKRIVGAGFRNHESRIPLFVGKSARGNETNFWRCKNGVCEAPSIYQITRIP